MNDLKKEKCLKKVSICHPEVKLKDLEDEVFVAAALDSSPSKPDQNDKRESLRREK